MRTEKYRMKNWEFDGSIFQNRSEWALEIIDWYLRDVDFRRVAAMTEKEVEHGADEITQNMFHEYDTIIDPNNKAWSFDEFKDYFTEQLYSARKDCLRYLPK